MQRLTNEQFDALVTLTRSKKGSNAREAARLHLVEGKSAPTIAREMAPVYERSAKEIYPIVWAAIKQALRALELCKKVVDV